jgi:hypothetical protein
VDLGSGNAHCGYRLHWMKSKLWLFLPVILILTGCSLQKMKSGLITGAATSAVVGATSVLPGGVIVPTIAAGVTSATASALTAEKSIKGGPVSVTADTVVQQAPDNFFTLLGKLIKIGGLATVLIVLVPMIFSWLMPGPIQFKGKKK